MIVLYQPFQNRTIPRPAPPPLPPLLKGGGLTARHKLLSCCVLIATHLPFIFTKLFCHQDGGIATSLLPKPHYPSKSTISLPPLSKVRCCRPKEFGRLPEGLPQLHRPSPSPQPLQKDNSTLLRTTFLPYERSASFASLRNSGRSTSGIHARPLSKGGAVALLITEQQRRAGLSTAAHFRRSS